MLTRSSALHALVFAFSVLLLAVPLCSSALEAVGVNSIEIPICVYHRFGPVVADSMTDRQALDAPALGVEIASALYRLYPRDFQLEKTVGLMGARWVIQAIKGGQDPRSIVHSWQDALDAFHSRRAKYLLY